MIEVRFIKNGTAVEPTYLNETCAALELTSNLVQYDNRTDSYVYGTGIRIETDKNYVAMIFPNSNGRDNDAYMVDHVGLIDGSRLREEIVLTFKNRTSLETRAINEAYKEFLKSLRYSNDIMSATYNSESVYNNVINDPYMFVPYYGGDVIGRMIVMPFEKANLIEVNAF